MFIIFSVFYILIAAGMTVLILMQRGEGADAGASFGGGSSGTVFGARGSAGFMGKATGVLAGVFFALSLGMAIYLSHHGAPSPAQNLGVMSGVGTTTSQSVNKKTPAPANQQPTKQQQSATAVPKAAHSAGTSSQAANPAGAAASQSAVPTVTLPAKKAVKAGTTSTKNKDGSSGSSKK